MDQQEMISQKLYSVFFYIKPEQQLIKGLIKIIKLLTRNAFTKILKWMLYQALTNLSAAKT